MGLCNTTFQKTKPQMIMSFEDEIKKDQHVLSEYDRHLIERSWAQNQDRIKKHSLDFFLLLFKEHPYMQDRFPFVRGFSEESLKGSTKIKAHALTVVYTIESYVINIHEAENVAFLIQKMTEKHIKRGVYPEDFAKIFAVWVEYMQKVLGKRCTPDISNAWSELGKSISHISDLCRKDLMESSVAHNVADKEEEAKRSDVTLQSAKPGTESGVDNMSSHHTRVTTSSKETNRGSSSN